MWSPWGRSSPTVRGASSPRPSFHCSSLKDVHRLYSDDDTTSPRKSFAEPQTQHDNENHNPNPNRQPAPNRKKVFHRVRVVTSLLRNLPTRPVPLATISVVSSTRVPEPTHITIAGAETRIVIYYTSIRAVRPTFDAYRAVQSILCGFRVSIDRRDVAMDSGFLDEVTRILGVTRDKLTLPAVFIGGHYVGGAEEVRQMHEIGELKKLIEVLPAAQPRVCDACGGYRFVVCAVCHGGRKVPVEKAGHKACTACNENGLIKCPICFPTALVPG